MTYKLTERAASIQPIPGVPWRDMTDQEFAKAAKEYTERGGFPPRSLHESGFWEHIPAEKPAQEG